MLTCARCGDHLCEACAAERVGELCAGCHDLLAHRGKVPHVQWLAVVTMVHGAMLLAFGALLVVYGGVLGVYLARVQTTRADAPDGDVVAAVVAVAVFLMAVGQLLPGVLQILAGWYAREFRHRIFALVALASGLLSVVGCYCLPTSIALLVWGLVVLFDDAVVRRFEVGPKA